MSIPTWAVLRAAGVPEGQASKVLVRARRIEVASRPDGAHEYRPMTLGWASWLANGVRPSDVKRGEAAMMGEDESAYADFAD